MKGGVLYSIRAKNQLGNWTFMNLTASPRVWVCVWQAFGSGAGGYWCGSCRKLQEGLLAPSQTHF